ncbi:YdcF family protein [Scytonema sp. UIC 10036]|uniref:YdcF family protein n=1 Tax=Scytonema sp. UIC 10036 TaxID=2304196 RepID=UPI001FAA37BE|nr:YdcF family protein [Scytonema sp. UIC 10036]
MLGLILILLSIIPVRLAIASYQAPFPQGILTLGGGADREQFTAQFAQHFPDLDIWVSSGTTPDQAYAIFQRADIPDSRLHLDYRAVDTVTNFTSLVPDFKQRHIQHLYVITSKFHMPRAKVIATLILGSQGITFTPLSVPSKEPKESLPHILRDSARSLLWIVTGRTGASLNPRLARSSYASK